MVKISIMQKNMTDSFVIPHSFLMDMSWLNKSIMTTRGATKLG